MPRNRILAIINVIAYAVVLLTNYLAVSLPLNNKTTGQLSDQYPNLFTPAGITFSIWGVIYLFLGIFVVYQLVELFKDNIVASKIKSITPVFLLNCAANASWLFAWHYEMVGLSVVIMLVMLSTLIIIHNRLNLAMQWNLMPEKLCLDIPFSLYLGWISIATIANVTTLLVSYQITPFGLSAGVWTIIMLAIATAITIAMIQIKSNYVFAFVVIWALFGIVKKRLDDNSAQSHDVNVAAHICMAIIAIVIITKIISVNRQRTK